MNYYEHHLGDFMRDTAHLTMLEEGAYRRLLDLYYIREQALPDDRPMLYRLTRAHTSADRKAIDAVIVFFFFPKSGFLHQRRVDFEIARFQDKREKAKASSILGVRARQRAANGDRTVTGRSTGRSSNDQPNGLPLQTPDTSHHIKNSETPPAATPETAPPTAAPRAKKGSRIPPDFAPDAQASLRQIHDLDVTRELARFTDYWQGKAGQAGVKADWHATWRNWLRTCLETGRYAKRGHSNPDNPHAHLEMR